jgi:hypothetical protein
MQRRITLPDGSALGAAATRVGRVHFNPPILTRWRIKGNPPYGSVYGQQPDQMRRIGVPMAHAESDREGQAFVAAFHKGPQNPG